jgi:hypothetical protein
MTKLATSAVAAAVMLTGLAGASTSSDAARQTAAPGRSQHVMRVVEQSIESHPLSDDHPAGVERLRSVATHKIVGYESFSGVFNPATDQVRFWLGTALKGGLIDSYFNVNTGLQSFTGRIVRGYGKYRGIEGTIQVRMSDSGRTVYTLRYSL